jgi:hypothetical protein
MAAGMDWAKVKRGTRATAQNTSAAAILWLDFMDAFGLRQRHITDEHHNRNA